jgi:hypothetical protein
VLHIAAPPSEVERYCAWFGDSRGNVLYFGQSAFWSAYRAEDGDPTADLAARGPLRIGRFDLETERMLAPLELTPPGPESRSGVWDVLAHPNGRIYFTTYFESAGYVDLSNRKVLRFPDAGPGLNELALGPEGSILVTRYGDRSGEAGAVVHLDAEGRVLREHRLLDPSGRRVAPKSLAFDPVHREIWVTTDLLPGDAGAQHHPTLVLDLEGRERQRITDAEVHFVAFGPKGTAYLAVVDQAGLSLALLSPDGPDRDLAAATRILLDPDFPAGLDFVQDLKIAADGRLVLTRWSGRISLIETRGDASQIANLRLPAFEPGGLYYTGVLAEGRLCATYCAGIGVVCAPAP